MTEKISSNEKWNRGLTIGTMVLVVIGWIVTYFWFDPQMRAFRNRGRLQITAPSTTYKIENLELKFQRPWSLKIKNIGNLPANDVQIIATYESQTKQEFEETEIAFDPPAKKEVTKDGKRFEITLKRPIPPQDTITLNASYIPDKIWVYNALGEGDSVDSGIKGIRVMQNVWRFSDAEGKKIFDSPLWKKSRKDRK